MDIMRILEGTREKELIDSLGGIYSDIEARQGEWKDSASFSCLDGCGDCCSHFEPDLLECEALYLAAWILESDFPLAQRLMDGSHVSLNNGDGCILFNPDSPYHCTVYGGRCLICRLFGYSGELDKDGRRRWRPCRFYPSDKLIPFEHRTYGEDELSALSSVPIPVMSHFMERALSLSPDSAGDTEPLRDAVVKALKRLMFIACIKGFDGDNDNGGGGNDNPTPLSA